MDYFLDTCVEVGYVFCTDPWNDESVEVFNDNDYLNYSHTVKMEFKKIRLDIDYKKLGLKNGEQEAYLEKEKLIADLFKEYKVPCTASSDKAIYELLVLSLNAEFQNILYHLIESLNHL